MAKLTKNRKESLTKFEAEKLYSLKEASDVIKSFSKLKFDSTIDLAVNLGVDPKKADQNVRGIVSLPNGTGKDVKVLALVTPDKEEEARHLFLKKGEVFSASNWRGLGHVFTAVYGFQRRPQLTR